MKTLKTRHSLWRQFLSGLVVIAITSLAGVALTGCGSDSNDAAPPPAIAAPGAPTGLTATGGENVATLQWSSPAASATAGQPDSYEIYHSATLGTAAQIVVPANFVATTPAVANQMVYSYTAINLAGGNSTHYFVVTAKNAGGETPSNVASAQVTGPPVAQTYGNNFSAALIFADDIGITNLALDPAKSWTLDPALIDYNTGLRPLATETIAALPSLTVASSIDPLWYEQKSVNTWQGQWVRAGGVPQLVIAKWGDNLAGSASLSSGAKIRIEMVLTKDVSTTPMTAYTMQLLSGSGTNELQGTNGLTYNPATAFVMATNARLVIQKFNGALLDPPVVNQALFDPAFPDGLNKLAGEIPVSGNFTYGFVWSPAASGSTAGIYRVTFKLDPISVFGTGNPDNNTFIQSATNGVYVDTDEVYIDINVR